MTDNEIVKALEVCNNGYCYRDGCPLASGLEDDSIEKCTSELSKAALDLINRQKAEIESLKIAIEVTRDNLGDARAELQKAEAESEIWKDIAKRETGYVEIARAEAIKEFAYRLKMEAFMPIGTWFAERVIAEKQIDRFVKEMTEETP